MACPPSPLRGSWATTAISRPAPSWAFGACYTFAIHDLLAATDRCPNRGSAAVDHLLAAIADDRANRGSTGINDLGPCAYRSRAARGPVDPLRGLKNWRKDAPTTKGFKHGITWTVGRDAMNGIVHLRIVITIFVVGGILALLPYALFLFLDGISVSPFGWVGGIGSIALAAWLSRGSNIARNLLVVFSILGLLFYGMLLFMTLRDNQSTAAFLGIFCTLSGYCLWALLFSKDVRAELARRRDA
jgi:hypothetical protein